MSWTDRLINMMGSLAGVRPRKDGKRRRGTLAKISKGGASTFKVDGMSYWCPALWDVAVEARNPIVVGRRVTHVLAVQISLPKGMGLPRWAGMNTGKEVREGPRTTVKLQIQMTQTGEVPPDRLLITVARSYAKDVAGASSVTQGKVAGIIEKIWKGQMSKSPEWKELPSILDELAVVAAVMDR